MHQLMDRIDKHKRVEDDQVQGKGKVKVFTLKWRDPQPDRFGPNRPRRDFLISLPKVIPQWLVFKEPIYRVHEKIKNKPYFK